VVPCVEAGSNTSTVTLRVVGGDEKESLKSETVKYGYESKGTRTQERLQKINVGPYAERAFQRFTDDTPMSVPERDRRHRERRRVDGGGASTSSAALPERMEIQSAAESPDPAETFSEPMQLDFTRTDVLQEHWNAGNEPTRGVHR
jgi:hypothetical protein